MREGLTAATPATPGSEAALVALIKESAERGEAIFCEGGGSKRHHGPAASAPVRAISLRGLDRVTAYEPADLVLSVQAGARLCDVQQKLGAHQQWLPLDPPYPDATIGGILATASVGPRRLGYGTSKDWLLGLRVAGPSGEISKSGGRVVKNVSGYDLHRLQVGAFGSLGVIVEAHFKVTPCPAVRAVLLFACPSFAAALEQLLPVAAGGLRPVALEAWDAGTVALLRAGCPALPDAPALAVVGVEGSQALVDRHVTTLLGADQAGTLFTGAAADDFWQAFAAAPLRAPDDLVVRVGARPRDLPALLTTAEVGALGSHAIACHAGTGVARLRLADLRADALGERLAAVDRVARTCGGYAVLEAAPLGRRDRAELRFSAGPQPLALAVKAAFDPQGRLNPGRMPL